MSISETRKSITLYYKYTCVCSSLKPRKNKNSQIFLQLKPGSNFATQKLLQHVSFLPQQRNVIVTDTTAFNSFEHQSVYAITRCVQL